MPLYDFTGSANPSDPITVKLGRRSNDVVTVDLSFISSRVALDLLTKNKDREAGTEITHEEALETAVSVCLGNSHPHEIDRDWLIDNTTFREDLIPFAELVMNLIIKSLEAPGKNSEPPDKP